MSSNVLSGEPLGARQGRYPPPTPRRGGDRRSVEHRIGALAEELDPGALHARVVLGGLHEVHEGADRRIEALAEPVVGEVALSSKAVCAWASENMSG